VQSKKLSSPGSAALLTVADFLTVAVMPSCCRRLDKDNKPGKFYDTGEDQHGVVAKRYGACSSSSSCTGSCTGLYSRTGAYQ
jgi:hypothetical protein